MVVKHIGFVIQELALFATNIKKNILYGKEGGSDAKIEKTSKSVDVHSFIVQFHKGYNT